MAHCFHARFECGNVPLEVDALRRRGELPPVNAHREIIESGANVRRESAQRRLELLCVRIFMAVFYGKIEREQRVKQQATELRKHTQPFAPSRAGGLIARGFKKLIVATLHCLHVIAKFGPVFSRGSAKAFENSFKECAEQQELLGKAVAQ